MPGNTMIYNAYHVCVSCDLFYKRHADRKCLYEPTWFKPAVCLMCQRLDVAPSTTGVIGNVRYYMCHTCDLYLLSPTYPLILSEITTELIAAYFTRNSPISAWDK